MWGWLRRIRRYRWIAWTIGAVGAALRLAWFIFSHYSWLAGIAAMIATAIGHYYSPQITDAVVAGLLAFVAVKVLAWQASLGTAVKAPARFEQPKITVAPKVDAPPAPNYAIWRQRDKYTIAEFAALLAGADPSVHTKNPDRLGFQLLIYEAAEKGKLPYVKRYDVNDWTGNKFETSIDTVLTEIEKVDAIKWAEANSFDISKIK